MKIKSLLFILSFLFIAKTLSAQNEDTKEESTSELAKKLANPNASLGQMLFPIDYIRYNGDINNSGQNAMVLNFQPSLPIPLSEGLNLYIRPLIPFYISQPVNGVNGFENKTALGNISADIAIGKTWPSKWITLVGIFGGFPTATNDALKAPQVTLGPEFMVAKLTNFGAVGLILSQAWGLGNPNDPDTSTSTILPDDNWINSDEAINANVTAGQYFYTINLQNGWQINATPTYAYNHNGTKGNKFTLPIGTGAQKVLKAGNLPFRIGLQYWYYVATPDSFGPEHQVRFTIAPVVPLPW